MMMSNSELKVKLRTVENATILAPIGEIDLSQSPALREHIADAQEGRPRTLIIDLGGVPYMDSSGVATLLEALRAAQKHGGRLILCSLQDRVRSILEITRLDAVFTIVESAEKGLTA